MYTLVEKWQASGKGVKAFAASHHIPGATFYYWIDHYKKHKLGFITLEVSEEQKTPPPTITLTYPGGIQLSCTIEVLQAHKTTLLTL